MKKEFNAEMKVVRFGAEDMIVTSGVKTITLSQFEDENKYNNIFKLGDNTTYTSPGPSELNGMYAKMTEYFGYEISSSTKFFSEYRNKNILGLRNITGAEDFNGTYIYDGVQFVKKQ